MNSLL
jgi:Ubiquitin carboxyl-terminal hydrolase